MTTPRRTIVRRTQAVVVGLGVAGSLATAAVIGLSTTSGTVAGTGSGTSAGQQAGRAHSAVQVRGEEGDDADEGGRTTAQPVTPQPAPAPPAGGTHGTTSGS